MKELILILMGGVLVNNYVLQRFLGICPFLGVSKKFNQASGMGIAVIFVMLAATAVTYPIQKLILDKFDLGYLQTIVFILVLHRLRCGIITVKACGAVARARAALTKLRYVLKTQISERVSTRNLRDLRNRVVAGDKCVL